MSPLQMGINAHLLSPEAGFRSAGVHGYIYNLIRHLPAVSDTADFLYTVFVGQGQVPPNERMRVIRSSWPTRRPLIRILWEQTLLPRQKLDLLHATAFVAPLLAPWPTVVTVYDLSFIHYPHTFPAGRRLYLRLMTRLSCRRARRVIAISQSTRRDLVQQWKLPPDKIEVACPGVGEGFRPLPADAVTAFRRQRNLPRRFILHVGTLQPRKNLVRLVQAYSRLRAIEPAVKLVLAGGKGWQYDELLAEIERLYLKDDVMLPGYVPAEELPLLYNAAELLALPSLYEGFGMPVVEAMACSTPVVASNASSLPEAAGDAGLLVPPHSVDGLAEALHRALTDTSLRTKLQSRGVEQAAKFTWGRTATATVAAYLAALETGR